MKNDESVEHSSDMYFEIESMLKRSGYFVFSHDDLRHQYDESIYREAGYQSEHHIPLKRISDDDIEEKEDAEHVQEMIIEKFKDSSKPKKEVVDDLDFDISVIVADLTRHMHRISRNVIGRDDIIEQLMYAILTGEHVLLMSRTGMAKSYLVNEIFNSFENVRVFSAQASKDQTPDNYFGPYDIEDFKRGIIRHNIKGSIIEANLVFLDEFFDASDLVLRSLLSVLNERKFINGSEQIDVTIHTAIATANYLRLNEVTEAVLDRFIYKAIIPDDDDLYNGLLIDQAYAVRKGRPENPPSKMPFEQIRYLENIIRNNNSQIKIEIPDSVKFVKNVIINKFGSEVRKVEPEFFISPRKQAKMADLLRACAIMDDRYDVTVDDLKQMYLGLVTLNRFIHVGQRDKQYKELFLALYDQTIANLHATNAFHEIDFLLNIKDIFHVLRNEPEKRERLHEEKGLLRGVKSLLAKMFPLRNRDGDSLTTIESLKRQVAELNPAVAEVRELKHGILRDYIDLF